MGCGAFGCCGDYFSEAGFGVIKFFQMIFVVLLAGVVLSGCRLEVDGGPPEIRYGDSLCAYCGMIISDARFATATILMGDRGHEPYVFDDFNCQKTFDLNHAEDQVVDRWCHDYESSSWIQMENAWFVQSDQLRTPMASNLASFAGKESADAAAESLGGVVLDFEAFQDLEE